jgi:hypothetical protein
LLFLHRSPKTKRRDRERRAKAVTGVRASETPEGVTACRLAGAASDREALRSASAPVSAGAGHEPRASVEGRQRKPRLRRASRGECTSGQTAAGASFIAFFWRIAWAPITVSVPA